MCRTSRAGVAALALCVTGLTGCQDLAPHHLEQLFKPRTELSEIVGFLAGLGTTFAAFPDLMAMLKRRSSEGMNRGWARSWARFRSCGFTMVCSLRRDL